ncbi:MAG: acetate--CoA ligase family protein [Patescibacteria group bacterium]|nr:acetate--CoA ligase family protein [Patescibacteria group bacterium]
MKNLQKLFNPKSIAIVGASPKNEKLGYILARNILSGGWRGKLYYVNPKYSRNKSAYLANLNEIRKPVDLVLVVIPAPFVNQAIEEATLARPKIENFVVISAGFKEIGKEGQKLEEGLENIAKKHKLNILGPNCLGFINPSQKLNATFTQPQFKKNGFGQASGKFKPGKIAIVSQSGALAVALLDWTQNLSVGFSKVISIGNKAALDECDILNFLAADKKTEAVALYLEDIKDGQKFAETAGKIASQKPLIVIKAGKNRAGQKAISSHTGSLAQDEGILEAIFEKLNIVEAKTIEEFQNLILYLNADKIPAKKEIIILTNAGGPGVLASDFIGNSKSLKLLKIPSGMKVELKKYLPGSASVENPIDIIGDAAPERYKNTLKIISRKFAANPLLVILTPQSQTDPENVARILKAYKRKFPAFAAVFMGGAKVKTAAESLRQNGIANFENPEEALSAIEKLAKYNLQKKKAGFIFRQKDIQLKLKTNAIIQSVIQEKRKMLFWSETEKIFKSYGIRLANSISFENLSGINLKKITYPRVLKTDDPKIIHRWDKKAVFLGIQNEKGFRHAFQKIKKTTGAGKFLAQPMAKPGLGMIVGLKRDWSFGPVIVVGWGGTYTEIFKDRVILVPPLTADEIKNQLQKLKIFPILSGFRGEKKYNLDEIAKIVLALQEIVAENPDVDQIDINPVLLYNNGSKYQILDAKIYF